MNIFQVALIQPLTNGLILFYNLTFQNMGLAIIAFSLFLRFVLNPLTAPYMASMKKIKEVEPLVAKLKLKYKEDKKGLMTAQTELYKQRGINPSAGCLPYILQIVILIALFNVFTQVLSQNGDAISKLNSMLYAPLKFAENVTLNTRFLYMDVRLPDVFNVSGIPFPIPGPILILAGLLQFLSAKMMQPMVKKEEKIAKDTKGGADDMAVAMQSSMIYTFPAMTILFGIKFPSGLALYWLLFSVFQMYQQYKSSGWGGLAPFVKRLGLIQLKP
ncbi:MAG: Membrane protein insertase, YidC/Oxa1 family [Candidatus Woesebacteria bacterium GW2011_GWA1_33_30]|uniref:Membrane protein insertase, YidC/Oxa1 family n=1 Tax=Candidatus Woesebacteria bacterium GW2011_GWA2_33_28 TaxID=1618561 RepID=A0A0F9ZQR9_9BACT|nr:MAG: Membrane protein insertase, YidC/Oxa1 family [Candidatus Woesebacteria bacterium GW2011_GWA2_33_28]KKP47289.1 MAG: Membrane protein insertase, YidC/Oxa1 family [Candidatus Woesebacteria bacterium GW2011_GWA1_33_30]KKP48934.1 MAG: Membrane protein insertase, YidC/Oxa1 family [Microgenomates group bacterium GW2011_GWC1_33_32]KKP51472.1 MAG: Membrane protein insertase, YidC/Oxa1 family [Candidatus Woesebacteria bacterium GW2011_GWB1_33_38]